MGHCFEDSSNFFDRIYTIDETCIHHCDPETKEQSKQWTHSQSPRPKKFGVQKSTSKDLASIIWDKDGLNAFCKLIFISGSPT